MITHCPSCHTHFRVHAEQLAARAGQVRCGKCSRIFDALEHLVEESVPPREASAAHDHLPTGADSAVAEAVLAPAPEVEAELGAEKQQPALAQSAGAEAETVEAEAGITGAPTPEPDAVALEPAQTEVAEPRAAPAANSFDFGPNAAAEPASQVRRWTWQLAALSLLLILLAQAAYYYRSELVVLFPEFKPRATALCAALGCELPLTRRIELMSIEASDLQADTDNPNIMVLSATLKNRASFDQQLPSLELTLTDAQDQPVVRRVLAPQDYSGKAVNIQAGFAANTEIAVKVFIEGSQIKATGYRLYLFYP